MHQEVQKYGNERRSCKVGMNSREQISRTGCLVFRTTPSVVVLDLINRWEEKYRNCCARGTTKSYKESNVICFPRPFTQYLLTDLKRTSVAGVRVIHRSTDLMDKLYTNIVHKYDTNIGPLIVHRARNGSKAK